VFVYSGTDMTHGISHLDQSPNALAVAAVVVMLSLKRTPDEIECI